MDKQEFYNTRFGPTRAASMRKPLQMIGSQLGIDFRFGGNTGNSRNSQRLVKLGGTISADVQAKVVRELQHAYFELNEDITNINQLIKLGIKAGIKAGIPADKVKDWMNSDKGGAEVDADVRASRTKGITGVPYFTINGKYSLSGAEPPEEFLRAFNLVKKADANGVSAAGRTMANGQTC